MHITLVNRSMFAKKFIYEITTAEAIRVYSQDESQGGEKFQPQVNQFQVTTRCLQTSCTANNWATRSYH